ncbi:MAG: HAD hydrolase family protein [Planctomycetes bacterium]|nr:HAD hydrolase family protein [Planctomycetota bacterium]
MSVTDVRVIVLDVDGVLTSGHVRYQGVTEETKTFHVHDGCAIKLWQRQGGTIALLSGRTSADVQRRADELGIESIRQGSGDKLHDYRDLLQTLQIEDRHVCCAGDDLPDLPILVRCGFAVAPADAVPAAKRVADYVTLRPGGAGAVAELIELVLRKQGRWPHPLDANGETTA